MAVLTRVPFHGPASSGRLFDRFFDEAFRPQWGVREAGETARPAAVDMYETDEEVVLSALLPGVDPEKVEVSIEDGRLTIHAHRPELGENGGTRWLRHELYNGDYARTVALPKGVDGDKAEASYSAGIMNIRIPKSAESKPRHIKVARAS